MIFAFQLFQTKIKAFIADRLEISSLHVTDWLMLEGFVLLFIIVTSLAFESLLHSTLPLFFMNDCSLKSFPCESFLSSHISFYCILVLCVALQIKSFCTEMNNDFFMFSQKNISRRNKNLKQAREAFRQINSEKLANFFTVSTVILL